MYTLARHSATATSIRVCATHPFTCLPRLVFHTSFVLLLLSAATICYCCLPSAAAPLAAILFTSFRCSRKKLRLFLPIHDDEKQNEVINYDVDNAIRWLFQRRLKQYVQIFAAIGEEIVTELNAAAR